MIPDLLAAIDTVMRIIAHENAALLAMDLRAAAALSDEKRRAVGALAALKPAAARDPRLRPAIARLDDLVRENQSLLARGLAAQGRVINMLAAAARSARTARPGQAARYDGYGRPAPAAAPAIAISARV